MLQIRQKGNKAVSYQEMMFNLTEVSTWQIQVILEHARPGVFPSRSREQKEERSWARGEPALLIGAWGEWIGAELSSFPGRVLATHALLIRRLGNPFVNSYFSTPPPPLIIMHRRVWWH